MILPSAMANAGPTADWPRLSGRLEVRMRTSGAVSAAAAAGSWLRRAANAPAALNSWEVPPEAAGRAHSIRVVLISPIRWRVLPDGEPLLQGGEDSELHGVPERGLPDEDGRERGGRVHVMIRHHPDRLQLAMVEQVGLVDGQDRDAAPLGGFPGQDAPGLDGERGGAVDGLPAPGRDDVGEDPPHPCCRVADVDDGVAGGVEAAGP